MNARHWVLAGSICLAMLTGWEKQEIRDRMEWPKAAEESKGGKKWYQKLWSK